MNQGKVLHRLFRNALMRKNQTAIPLLRQKVFDYCQITPMRIPDRVLLDCLARKVFSIEVEIPQDRVEDIEYKDAFQDNEELFEI